jgi:hypothetical protein
MLSLSSFSPSSYSSPLLFYSPLPHVRSSDFSSDLEVSDMKGRKKGRPSANEANENNTAQTSSDPTVASIDDSSLPPLSDEEIIGDSSSNTPNLAHNSRKNTHSARLHPVSACSLCPADFYSDKELQAHNAEVHSKYQCFSCISLVLFHSQRAVRHHIKRFHSNPKEKYSRCGFQCADFCGRFFEDIHDLRNHLGTHEYSFRCEKCPKAFSTHSRLQNHIAGQHFLEEKMIVEENSRRERKAPTRLVELVDPDVLGLETISGIGTRNQHNSALNRPQLRMKDSDDESEEDEDDPAYKAPKAHKKPPVALSHTASPSHFFTALFSPLRAHLLFNSEEKLRFKVLPNEIIQKKIIVKLNGIQVTKEEFPMEESNDQEEKQEMEMEREEILQENASNSNPQEEEASPESAAVESNELAAELPTYVKRTKRSAFKSSIHEVRTFQIEDSDDSDEESNHHKQSHEQSSAISHNQLTSSDLHVASEEEKKTANEMEDENAQTPLVINSESTSLIQSALVISAVEVSNVAVSSSVQDNQTQSNALVAPSDSDSESDFVPSSSSRPSRFSRPSRSSIGDQNVVLARQRRCLLPICNKFFPCDYDVFSHIRDAHKKFACLAKSCQRLFDSGLEYENHLSSDGEELVGCSICCARFASFSIAKQHTRIHETISLCQIAGCNARFRSDSQLSHHSLLAHGMKLEEIPEQPIEQVKLEAAPVKLVKPHLSTHHFVEPEKEKEREKRKRHRLRLAGQVNCECSVPSCPLAASPSFYCDIDLNDHLIQSHSLYQCFFDDCGKQFSSADERTQHFSVHYDPESSSSPFPCELCGLRLKLAANLSRHGAAHKKLIICDCGKFIVQTSVKAMEKHRAKYHKSNAPSVQEGEDDEGEDEEEQPTKRAKQENNENAPNTAGDGEYLPPPSSDVPDDSIMQNDTQTA